jgi:hypothetical protein
LGPRHLRELREVADHPAVLPEDLVGRHGFGVGVRLGEAPRERDRELLRLSAVERGREKLLAHREPAADVAVCVGDAGGLGDQVHLGRAFRQVRGLGQQTVDDGVRVPHDRSPPWSPMPHSMSASRPSLSSCISFALSGWCPSRSDWR